MEIAKILAKSTSSWRYYCANHFISKWNEFVSRTKVDI